MGEVVNLTRARKQKLREDKAKLADQNRAKFGRKSSDKNMASALDMKAEKLLDGHMLPTTTPRTPK